MTEPTNEDIAAMRADGSLREYFQFLTGRQPAQPKPAPVAEPEEPGYRITHPGGWPIGTAATGPTPTHGRCACIKCERAAVVQLSTVRPVSEGEAA